MAVSEYQQYIENKVFGGLDGLRFLSIFAVVWHHSVGVLENFPATRFGFLGVDLFFVISGFLIVTLLLREHGKNGDISLKAFYIRRTLRIFPLYYGFILLLVTAYFLFNRDSEFGKSLLNDLPIYLLYLGNFFTLNLGIVWSLASEEQFYLVWPFFEKFFKKFILYILFFFIAVNQVINFQGHAIAKWLNYPELAELHIFQTTFTPILLGVALAHILNNEKTYKRIKILINRTHSAIFFLAALILFCSYAPNDISGFPRLIIQTLMTLLVASVVIRESHSLMPFLRFPPIARIGVISYGIYLFHILAITISEKLLLIFDLSSNILKFLVAFLVVILAAEISYRFYERPFLRLKAKFSAVHQKHT